MSLDPAVEDKFVEVNGLRIRYIEKGAGRPLLCLHGMGYTLSADMWLGQLDKFAAFSHVYAMDIPGWGLSDPLPNPTFPAWARVVKGFCDALGLTELDVFGYSIGGWISCIFARDNPQMVRRMMLLDAPGLNLPAPNFVANFQLPTKEKVHEDLSLHTPGYASPAQLDQMYERVSRPSAEAAYRAAAGHVADPEARKTYSLHSVYPQLKMPLLIAQMDNANGVYIKYIFEAYQLAPHARMLIYYGGNQRLVGGVKAVPEATAIEFFTAAEVSVPPQK